jgi:hypothetical protein
MSRQLPSRKNLGRSNRKPPELDIALNFIGIFTRIAKENGVSTSHALKVAKGDRASKHISDAIVREARRILRKEAAA